MSIRQPVNLHRTDKYWLTAYNSTFRAGDIPLFYVPAISVPVDDQGTPLTGVGFGQDRIFGTQIKTQWNGFSLFGIERPQGLSAKWNVRADYFTLRGPLLGTDGNYSGTDDAGNTFKGIGMSYYANDGGFDNLGRDRRAIAPADPNRGMLQWTNTYNFPDVQHEAAARKAGYASDRNFRESYFERDFDTGKDLDTLANLSQRFSENATWSVLGQVTPNNFENNTGVAAARAIEVAWRSRCLVDG